MSKIIKVDKIMPNPFRNIKKYPIDKDKVESLKTSIEETEFWDNIVVRRKNDKYELCFGHHRLAALKELGIKEIDIPVKKINDATMLKMMANENLSEWSCTPAMINETVKAAKGYLDKLLRECETSQKFMTTGQLTSCEIMNEQSYGRLKKTGSGRELIFHFLNGHPIADKSKKPIWSERKIKDALALMSGENKAEKEAEKAKKLAKEKKLEEDQARQRAIEEEKKIANVKNEEEKQKAIERATTERQRLARLERERLAAEGQVEKAEKNKKQEQKKREVAEKFDNMNQANKFKSLMNRYKIPEDQHDKFVASAKNAIKNGRTMEESIYNLAKGAGYIKEEKKEKQSVELEEYLQETRKVFGDVKERLDVIGKYYFDENVIISKRQKHFFEESFNLFLKSAKRFDNQLNPKLKEIDNEKAGSIL